MTATANTIRRPIADPAPVRHACLAALLAACSGRGPLPCGVHCGHYDAAPPYGYPTLQGTTWTCQLDLHPDLVNGSPCTITNGCLASPTSSFANACAQGYLPIDIGYNGATLVACVALCSPGNTYAGNPDPQYPIGRTPHTCSTTDARGSFDPSTQCMFSWWFERGGAPTPTSNTVGLCIDHAALGWPDCATLSVTDAATFGCVDTAHASL